LAFLQTGNEPPSRSLTISLATVNNRGQPFFSHIMGARYGQPAISYNSTEHILFCGMFRKIGVQSEDLQATNYPCLQLFVTGWITDDPPTEPVTAENVPAASVEK
jgi:hypothetical protein